MKKYDNLISEFSEENIDMIVSELPEFTNENLNNIKNKFRKKTMKRASKSKKIIIRSLTTAACICAVFVGMVNIDNAFAANLLDVPVIGDIVNLVTVNKMALYDKYKEINIEIPSIEGLEDNEVQKEINSILKERAIAVYDKALENSEKIKEDSQKKGFLTFMPEIVDQSYTLIRNSDDILSFKVVTTQIKASGYETADFYNVDLKNSKLLNISSLFNKNYDYISVINNEIVMKMKEEIEKEDAGYFPEEFKTIDDKTNFYINKNGKLVIVFNEYEISAGYMGMPEFIIDTSVFGNNISDLGYLK
ncbi:anti-sigma-V factor rsiV [Tepidibacter aestuarii]|uniref:anti-sigma-V factor rsiV n=1 Tax=Tepidibacter aestuarii TaxID=2925782 RepID=UPI0020BD9E92|nr:anti-sigma-V factor rsiV [Tepidibacter aestuarii]CAH2212238.1 putative Anti-sigma-V factor RsiV [Tepidibacter aestuarii]